MAKIKLQKEVIDVINQVADKFDISYDDAYNMYISQFDMAKKAIESGDKGDYESMKQVQLGKLGTFVASEGKWRHMKAGWERKEARLKLEEENE